MYSFSQRLVVLLMLSFFTLNVHADLNMFLADLNVQAKGDNATFNMNLSVQFGVPLVKVESMSVSLKSPSDLFMSLELARMSHRDPVEVSKVVNSKKSKGWGAIAKELGIKPGSSEFHALKNGDFHYNGKSNKQSSSGKSNKGNKKGKKK